MNIWMNEGMKWMIGVLGHDSTLLRLYWAGDNLGERDEFLLWTVWMDGWMNGWIDE